MALVSLARLIDLYFDEKRAQEKLKLKESSTPSVLHYEREDNNKGNCDGDDKNEKLKSKKPLISSIFYYERGSRQQE